MEAPATVLAVAVTVTLVSIPFSELAAQSAAAQQAQEVVATPRVRTEARQAPVSERESLEPVAEPATMHTGKADAPYVAAPGDPIAIPDAYFTIEDSTLTISAPGLRANDLDLEGDDFIVAQFFPVSNGTLNSILTNGAFEYEPNPGFTGTDSFTYRLQDSEGNFSEFVTVFVFVQAAIELPVELFSFGGVVEGRDVVLEWRTASETNNAGFEVQRRDEGEFEAIGFVEGAGTAHTENRYTYRVTDLEPGGYAFRLKQIDFDGAFEYSSVIELSVEVPGSHYLSEAYPNPFHSFTSLTLSVARDQDVEVDVIDLLGRRVVSLHRGPLAAGEREEVTFEAGALPSGLYVVRVSGDAFTATRKVVKN